MALESKGLSREVVLVLGEIFRGWGSFWSLPCLLWEICCRSGLTEFSGLFSVNLSSCLRIWWCVGLLFSAVSSHNVCFLLLQFFLHQCALADEFFN